MQDDHKAKICSNCNLSYVCVHYSTAIMALAQTSNVRRETFKPTYIIAEMPPLYFEMEEI
uniref:Uncharacterized protein n=1 Tax=Arundo donax TaxID=35708 RepID=A0A0A9BC03_ARUDO